MEAAHAHKPDAPDAVKKARKTLVHDADDLLQAKKRIPAGRAGKSCCKPRCGAPAYNLSQEAYSATNLTVAAQI